MRTRHSSCVTLLARIQVPCVHTYIPSLILPLWHVVHLMLPNILDYIRMLLKDWRAAGPTFSPVIFPGTSQWLNAIPVPCPAALDLHCLRLFTFIFLMTAATITAIIDTIFRVCRGPCACACRGHVCVSFPAYYPSHVLGA